MEEIIKYEVSLRKEYVTTDIMLSWIDLFSELISPDSMKISTFGSSFWKYDTQILKEEIEGEEIKKDISWAISSKNEIFTIHDRREESILLMGIRIFRGNLEQEVNNLIEDIMCKGLGVIAFEHPTLDDFAQNLESIESYQLYFGDTKGKKIIHPRDMPSERIIDVEYNPGHKHLEEGIWFGAFHCMWFGKGFYQYIPKEKLKAFSDCYENVELENEVLRIKLYEDMWDCENSVNRNRQRAFRTSVGIDEVAHSLHGRKKRKVTDPLFEILPDDENGNSVIRFYFTKRGKNVPKSQADVERTYFYAPGSKLLRVEHRNLRNKDSKDEVN